MLGLKACTAYIQQHLSIYFPLLIFLKIHFHLKIYIYVCAYSVCMFQLDHKPGIQASVEAEAGRLQTQGPVVEQVRSSLGILVKLLSKIKK